MEYHPEHKITILEDGQGVRQRIQTHQANEVTNGIQARSTISDRRSERSQGPKLHFIQCILGISFLILCIKTGISSADEKPDIPAVSCAFTLALLLAFIASLFSLVITPGGRAFNILCDKLAIFSMLSALALLLLMFLL